MVSVLSICCCLIMLLFIPIITHILLIKFRKNLQFWFAECRRKIIIALNTNRIFITRVNQYRFLSLFLFLLLIPLNRIRRLLHVILRRCNNCILLSFGRNRILLFLFFENASLTIPTSISLCFIQYILRHGILLFNSFYIHFELQLIALFCFFCNQPIEEIGSGVVLGFYISWIHCYCVVCWFAVLIWFQLKFVEIFHSLEYAFLF